MNAQPLEQTFSADQAANDLAFVAPVEKTFTLSETEYNSAIALLKKFAEGYDNRIAEALTALETKGAEINASSEGIILTAPQMRELQQAITAAAKFEMKQYAVQPKELGELASGLISEKVAAEVAAQLAKLPVAEPEQAGLPAPLTAPVFDLAKIREEMSKTPAQRTYDRLVKQHEDKLAKAEAAAGEKTIRAEILAGLEADIQKAKDEVTAVKNKNEATITGFDAADTAIAKLKTFRDSYRVPDVVAQVLKGERPAVELDEQDALILKLRKEDTRFGSKKVSAAQRKALNAALAPFEKDMKSLKKSFDAATTEILRATRAVKEAERLSARTVGLTLTEKVDRIKKDRDTDVQNIKNKIQVLSENHPGRPDAPQQEFKPQDLAA